jgi:hypothetical protein
MRDDDAVNRAVGGNGNTIDNAIKWVAQKFEAGDEGDVEIATGELGTERRRMIECDRAGPPTNERTGVEVFYAAEACRLQSGK